MNFFKRLWSRRSNAPDIPKPPKETDAAYLKAWRIFSVKNNGTGEVAIFRIRISQPTRPDLREFKTAVVIEWPYEASSLPFDTVNQQQLEYERALDPLSFDNDNSELVQVTTGLGLKEWRYYVRNRDIFMESLNTLLSGHSVYPIKVEFYDDPEWKIWTDIIFELTAKGQGVDLSSCH